MEAPGMRTLWAMLAAVTLIACDSSGQAPTLSPGINLSVSGPSAALTQGSTATATVSITRTGGYRGPVQVSAEGAPAGVAIAPLTIAADATSGSLAITAAADASPTTATITVRANGTGVAERSATFGLSVQTAPSFTMTADQTSLSVPRGGSASTTLALNRTGGFTGPISFAATGAPAGITVAFSPVNATGATSTVTISASANAPVGNHTITIRGVSGVSPDRTVTLNVEVPSVRSIGISLSPSAIALAQGGSGSVTVTLTRNGGFTDPVAITTENVPAGVSVSGVTIGADATTAVLAFTAAPGAAPTSGNVTVRAQGPGVPDATATASVSVTGPASFTMAIAPTSVTLPTGGSTNVAVAITRIGGFAGTVALSATGAPPGLAVSFSPASVTGTQATLTITAASTLAAGTYPVALRATAVDQPDQTAVLNVTITTSAAISIVADPASVEVPRGGTASVAINLTRGGGFTGPVTLTAENLPNGVSIGGATIPAGATSTSLTITATDAAVLMLSHVTVRAQGAGVSDATAGFDLRVTQAATYSMSVSPASVSVPAGASVTSTVNLLRSGGFSGAVQLNATGAPAGMTVSFNPSSVTTNQSTITVTTSAGVAPGTYPISIVATAPELNDRTATLSVQVTGSQTGGNVTWRFCTAATGLPVWVAAQDGTGSWTRITGAGDAYTFQISTRGGIAYVINNGGVYELYVQYGTRDELQNRGATRCDVPSGPRRTINGTVVGLEPTDFMAQISMGGGFAVVVPAGGSAFQLTDVQPGTVDLVGARIGASQLGGLTTTRLFIQRGLNPPNNASVTVDFTGQNSFVPVTPTLTLNGLGGDQASVVSTYFSSAGTPAVLGFDAERTSATTRNFVGVPAGRQAAGDFHMVTAEAVNPTHLRSVVHIFRTAADRVFTLGPAMGAVQATVVASQPYARVRLSYSIQAEYNSYFTANFTQDTREATIQTTAGYLGSSNLVLEVPNFAGVAGWNDDWGLRPGVVTDWSLGVAGWSAGAATPQNPWFDNTIYRTALRWGEITP